MLFDRRKLECPENKVIFRMNLWMLMIPVR